MKPFDIAIIGSGFGGSLLALIARKLGRSVIMIESGKHPRFAIGESSTPLANLLLERLAARYDLPALGNLSKWGTWQKHHPEISCGLKRGFSFYHHNPGQAWRETSDHSNELLVAASPRDAIADTHWYRPEFDHFLVRQAQAAGTELMDETLITQVSAENGRVTVDAVRGGQRLQVGAKFLVNAAGPRSTLHRLLGVREASMAFMPATTGLYTHFRNVQRLDKRAAPYPPDDAAVHHVFPGGWVWVLRFNNGITSAGVAATKEIGERFGFADGEPAWNRLLDQLPTVKAQFSGAMPVLPFTYAPRLCFRTEKMSGSGWAMLPSAAGFIDPLLSTGFPLTLSGIGRLAAIIEHQWGSTNFCREIDLYAQKSQRDLDTAERLVAALYHSMNDFPLFTRLSLVYFAAASYSETALRLGRDDLAGDSFLLADHPDFGPAKRDCLKAALTNEQPRSQTMDALLKAIAIVDVAGLSDFSRRNWYPARADDLLHAADKLDSSEKIIRAMLERTGFVA